MGAKCISLTIPSSTTTGAYGTCTAWVDATGGAARIHGAIHGQMPGTSAAKACTRQVILFIGARRLLYCPWLFLGLLCTTKIPAQASRWAPWWSSRTSTRSQHPFRKAECASLDVWTRSRVEKMLEQSNASGCPSALFISAALDARLAPARFRRPAHWTQTCNSYLVSWVPPLSVAPLPGNLSASAKV